MPSTMFDSAIFRDAFGAPAMRAVFCDEATIARYVEVEVALAAAEANVGVIPKDAAASIKRLARADAIDVAKLKAETDLVGYPIVGIVHQLAKQCGEAGRYVHWGATTQDIMDSATVLQLREALPLIDADLAALEAALAALAGKHRDTVMAGRTHLQHACRSPSATRRPSGSAWSPATASAWPSSPPACWSASSPARRARWPRSATRASPCTTR